MTKSDLTDQDLDTLFAAVRQDVPDTDDAFLARLQADVQRTLAPATPAPRPGFWSNFKTVIGGWGGVGGLATATVAGFWIGIAPPDTISGSADVLALLGNSDSAFESWFNPSDVDLLLEEDL